VGHSTSIVGLEELQASWKPQPAAGLSHSEPPRPRVSSVSRSLTEADAVGDPDFTSRPVVLWEHLVGEPDQSIPVAHMRRVGAGILNHLFK
jgi:hypothetical protein